MNPLPPQPPGGRCTLRLRQRFAFRLVLLIVLVPAFTVAADERIEFNRDVRPILSEHCWRCHGFDEQSRQGGLRLDVRDAALQPVDSGQVAIIPGLTDASELIARVTTADEQLRMPPTDAPRRLTEREVDILRRWIAQGAEYERHWALLPVVRPVPPTVSHTTNPIDAFVAVALERQGLTWSPEADPATLLRRVSFDLTGLPPTLADLDRIGSESYEQTVDRLLASPHFGERMAVDWLDAARFADTDGYFGDKPRQMWLWREWVIDAFNQNMPFDQFTIEQLAGDLLPDATTNQRIATGFNRNHMSNDESGLIAEEFRVESVVDRVDTTMSIWLGLTVGCAQCHDHKYDPISQREYYQLFAFFNNVPESGLLVGHDAPPRISVPTAEQEESLTALATEAAAANAAFEPLRAAANADLATREQELLQELPTPPENGTILHASFDGPLEDCWQVQGTSLQQVRGIRGQGAKFDATQHLECAAEEFSADAAWSIGFWLFPDGSLSCPLSKIEPEGDRRGIEVLWQKGRLNVNLVHQWGTHAIEVLTRVPVAAKQWHHVVVSYDGTGRARGLQVLIDGQEQSVEVRRDSLAGSFATTEPLRIGRRDMGLGFYGQLDEIRIVSRKVSPEQVREWRRGERLRGVLELPVEQRSPQDLQLLLDDHIDHRGDAAIHAARDAVQRVRKAEQALRAEIPLALVMDDLTPPRQTWILKRGQYDKPAEAVQPGVPAALSPWSEDASRNRLGLAQWLVAPEHPLTARVAVNRLWQQCFGAGLVPTMNDFGTQGTPPSHPELLDYLAATFRDSGWDVKRLLRLIVTSRTYRQDSRFTRAGAEVIDPENRWLSRGPRFRLPIEMLRDQALAASGLLVRQFGGPSVKPYQPPGLWEEVSYNGAESYQQSSGDGLWRRSLYTYIKRQAPPPALLLFDGPTREKCTLRRPRTNTPLQALLLLNDETYIEAARHLATHALSTSRNDTERLTQLTRSVLSRFPVRQESIQLLGLLERQQQRFAADRETAERLLSVGVTRRDAHVDAVELAAWTVVAHTLLNLDEAVTRR